MSLAPGESCRITVGLGALCVTNLVRIIPNATTTQKGISQLADAASVNIGTDATKAVTPAALSGSKRACRIWASFTGTSTPSINSTLAVSSITYISTGRYTANFTSAMADANYAVAFTWEAGANSAMYGYVTNKQTTSVSVQTGQGGTFNAVGANAHDIIIFGN